MHFLLSWCVSQIEAIYSRIVGIEGAISAIEAGGSSGGGSTAVQQVFKNAGDPNGVVSALSTAPALCIDTTNNVIWSKTDGVVSNTGWGNP